MSKLDPPDIQMPGRCRVCSKHVSLNSTRHTQKYNIFKTTKCCKECSVIYAKCARQFCAIIDPSYEFDPKSYEKDDNMHLYCFICEKKCFYCLEKHTSHKVPNSMTCYLLMCVQYATNCGAII